MKIYLVYNGEDVTGSSVRSLNEPVKLKLTLPETWKSGPCQQLIAFFVKNFNKTHEDSPITENEVSLKCGGVLLKNSDTVQNFIHDYNDVYVLHNLVRNDDPKVSGGIVCTNFGCGEKFTADDNKEDSCHFHAGGPVFHDIDKYWSCCPQHKARDWEEFERIPKCQTGYHSTQNKPITFKPSSETPQPLSVAQAGVSNGAVSRNDEAIEGIAHSGPREFEGARATLSEPQSVVDGKAVCKNFGCGSTFVVADNNDTACTHHKDGPVFWDTYKYWKCCPDKKRYEFDDFVKIPGCVVGPHKL